MPISVVILVLVDWSDLQALSYYVVVRAVGEATPFAILFSSSPPAFRLVSSIEAIHKHYSIAQFFVALTQLKISTHMWLGM